MNTKLTRLLTGVVLTVAFSCGYAEDTHIDEALVHAEAAVKATDAKGVGEHAEAAKAHVKVAIEHLNSGNKSLESAIEHSKKGHTVKAQKAAEEAVNHLKAAKSISGLGG
jgi:hypothetical protein